MYVSAIWFLEAEVTNERKAYAVSVLIPLYHLLLINYFGLYEIYNKETTQYVWQIEKDVNIIMLFVRW